jgi:hypothetical protein
MLLGAVIGLRELRELRERPRLALGYIRVSSRMMSKGVEHRFRSGFGLEALKSKVHSNVRFKCMVE